MIMHGTPVRNERWNVVLVGQSSPHYEGLQHIVSETSETGQPLLIDATRVAASPLPAIEALMGLAMASTVAHCRVRLDRGSALHRAYRMCGLESVFSQTELSDQSTGEDA